VGGVAHGFIAIGFAFSSGVVSIGMNAVGVIALGMNCLGGVAFALINGLGVVSAAGVNSCGAWSWAGVNNGQSPVFGFFVSLVGLVAPFFVPRRPRPPAAPEPETIDLDRLLSGEETEGWVRVRVRQTDEGFEIADRRHSARLPPTPALPEGSAILLVRASLRAAEGRDDVGYRDAPATERSIECVEVLSTDKSGRPRPDLGAWIVWSTIAAALVGFAASAIRFVL
jgi:hypothetical protein